MAEITEAIKLNRVKMASEAYSELKIINAEDTLAILVPREPGEEIDDVDVNSIPTWPMFRDQFIADWAANRVIVTDKEADAMFDKTADDALAEIEQQEQNGTDETGPVVDLTSPIVIATGEPVGETAVVEMDDVPAVKRRGRPASKKTVKVVKAKAKGKTVKAKAKKSNRGSASAKAQTIIENYGARGWPRKKIIEKVMTQLEMGAPYASTLYQKYA